LILPNLETRALLDKTGAWEFDNVDTSVLPGLTIEDNPHLEQSPFSAVFDFEGTPTKPIKIMKSGVLVHPLMTSSLLVEVESLYPQWKGRFQLTGHADSANSTSFTNLFFRVEKPPLPDLSKLSYIQIQNLTGMSVDPLTGQFALDADGAKVIENGKLMYPTSLTLRGNFFDALKHPSTRAGSLERHFNTWTPSLFTEALSCVSKELAQNFEDDEV
jgi:predicted Zn-dependent protease